MGGRKPLPVAIKKIKGTLQKCRTNPHEPRPDGQLGAPPEYMSDIAKEAWTYAVENAPLGLFSSLMPRFWNAGPIAQVCTVRRWPRSTDLVSPA